MTTQSTMDKLIEMRMTAMSDAFRTQISDPKMKEISFEDRFGMLVDIEYSNRKSNKLNRFIRKPRRSSKPSSLNVGSFNWLANSAAIAVIFIAVSISIVAWFSISGHLPSGSRPRRG